MLFNSTQFFLFLAIVLVVYWRLPPKGRIPLIVVASYVFYGSWDYRFLVLIWISTLADYFIARTMQQTDVERTRRRLLMMSLAVNFGILGFFKYFNFFVDSFVRLADSLGLAVSPPILHIILPVGISFYTFQTVSYTIDVYRRRVEAEPSLIVFAAYVAYFPQLVAGPIERARQLLPQLRTERPRPGRAQVKSAAALIITGLVKKVVLADGVAAIVDARFADPTAHGTLSLAIGLMAFSIQIYGDFSGYTSIARGVSRLLGIELIRNFEQPYLSPNIASFWRTWHMSLSSWLWDYLYVPLGGNRMGRHRTYLNLMITMLLGGLWHGAGWHFVVWGGLHGAYLLVHRAFGRYAPRGRPAPPKWSETPRILATFVLVTFTWVFFRADSMGTAMDYVGSMLQPGNPFQSPVPLDTALVLVTTFGLALLILDLIDRSRSQIQPLSWGPIPLGVATGAALVALLIWSGGDPQPFLYFQF